MAGLAFNRMFGGNRWTAIGYRSPESGQNEITIHFASAADNTWETAYTVPTGKILFVTDFVYTSDAATTIYLGYGATPSVIAKIKPTADTPWGRIDFHIVPMRFAPGETIKFKGHASIGKTELTIIGWQE